SVDWLTRLSHGPIIAIRGGIEPLIAFVLVGWLVYEDPLAGSDGFWVTRPISGARLLGAKALSAVVLFVVLPILVNVPWWLSCGFGAAQVAQAAVPMAIEYGSVVIVGLGVASATTSFPRYFLWTIAGLAGLVALHLMAAEISRAGLGFQNTQAIGNSMAITRVIVLFACVLLLCAEIGLHQFLSRHFRKSLLVASGFTVAASMAVFCTHLDFFPGNAWNTQAYGKLLAKSSEVAMIPPAGTAADSTYDSYMFVPLTLTRLAPGMAAYWQAQGEWSDGNTTIWKTGGVGGSYQNALIQLKTASLLGLSKDFSEFACGENFQFPRSLAERYAGKPLSFHAKIQIYLLKAQLAADRTVAEQSFMSSGSSLAITDVVKGDTALSLTITDRFQRLNPIGFLGAVWPRSTTWAVVNRPRAEIRTGREAFGSDMIGLQLNMVSVVVETVSFPKIPSHEWLDGARLVAFDFEGDHNVEQSLDETPFRYSYLSAEESRFRYKTKH
ncbi:MAG TPA: hypothetical protein VFE25_12595, partial [Opitutaceae bacterium]|nr:hypothetical protein [Opitutaceae bacterium]